MFLYSLFSLIGMGMAVLVAKKMDVPEAPQHKEVLIAALIGMLLGAKIPVWMSYGFEGYLIYGKSFMGGLLGAFIAVNFYKVFTRQAGNNFGIRFVIPLSVAVGFGKIGCWFNGCCGGKAGQNFGFDYCPVQLLESAFQFIMAFVLCRLCQKPVNRPLLFPLYVLCYLLMRFAIEFWRVEPVIKFGLTAYQLLSLLFAPLFGFIILQRLKKCCTI